MTLRSGMALIQATWDDLEKIEANKEKIRDLLDRCERVFEVVRRQLEIIILNDRENAIRQLIRYGPLSSLAIPDVELSGMF